jgi:thymidylate synthase (FAD)
MSEQKLPERLVPEDGQPTLRPISEGAEKWLYRPIQCLDHGFVYLVDYLGNDDAVVQAARVSYGRGTKRVTEDRGLIRYLRRHLHTTPSEMVEFKFHCKMPIFVARQWIRHRTASVNEYSGRYSEMVDEFYLPDTSVIAKQSKDNKQGRGGELSPEQKKRVLELLKEDYTRTYAHYKEFIGEDTQLARELARIGLSVANYTEWYWKIDLHNLLHFLKLRMDAHAQYEIRVFADAMARIVKDAVPLSFEAFEDYQLGGMQLSRLETEFLKTEKKWPLTEDAAREAIFAKFNNKRETEEFIGKLKALGFVK